MVGSVNNVTDAYERYLKLRPLSRAFYNRDSYTVARELVGKILVRYTHPDCVVVRLVEVEAYGGEDDPASYARKSLRGVKNKSLPMFGIAGATYITHVHGKVCLNIVAHQLGEVGAVLIRSVLPVTNDPPSKVVNGPAKSAYLLRITEADQGIDITSNGDFFIADARDTSSMSLAEKRRIGLRHDDGRLWRFSLV